MLKREWGAESNGKLPYLFIPSKTATLVPEYAVEDLPLDRTAALVPEFTVKRSKPLIENYYLFYFQYLCHRPAIWYNNLMVMMIIG